MATESEDQGELEETNDEGGEICTTASQPGLFRLYNYLTVSSYCNKQIKTVKSVKTIIGIKNSKTLKR